MGYLKVKNVLLTASGGLNAKPVTSDFDGLPVTPADATALPAGICYGVFASGAGNITGVTPSGATVALTGVPANTVIHIAMSIIGATGTTATGILALY
jgi:hypothetical protein